MSTRKTGVLLMICTLHLLALSACGASGQPKGATVSGTVTYRQRIALPAGAVVTVQIRDVSLMDAPAKVMGEELIETDGHQVPIPYSVAYDPDEIDERNSYSMSARIEDGTGKLLFISDTTVPVITHDNPTKDVEIVVVPLG